VQQDSAVTLYELILCVRRGPAGVSPQSAAVYADATCHPAEPKLAANNSLSDPSEQSATTPGQYIVQRQNSACVVSVSSSEHYIDFLLSIHN